MAGLIAQVVAPAVLAFAIVAQGAVLTTVAQGTVLTVAQGAVLTTVAQGAMSSIEEPRQVVVRTPVEWQALWKQHNSARAAPAVDFTQSTVAAVFLGSRPSAGFSVEITAVRTDGNRTIVEYRERQPSPDAFVAQMLTSPFHAVRFARTAGPVEFRRLGP